MNQQDKTSEPRAKGQTKTTQRRIAATIGFAMLVGFFIWRQMGNAPQFEGKTIKEWVQVLCNSPHNQSEVAHEALKRIGPKAVPHLIRAIEYENDKRPRIYRTLHEQLPPAIRKRLPEPEVYIDPNAAFDVLLDIEPVNEKAIELLIVATQDSVDTQRFHATMRLARAPAGQFPQIVEALIPRLTDNASNVREAAGYALSELGPDAKPSLPALLHHLKSEPAEHHSWTLIRALERMEISTPEVLQSLHELFEVSDPTVQAYAIEVYWKLGGDPSIAVQAFDEFLDQGDKLSVGIGLIGHLGSDAKSLLPRIENYLTDSDEQIRVYAARAIWSITGESERPAAILAEAARTGSSYTRYRALEFLAPLENELERNQDAIATALNESDRARNKLLALELLQRIPNLSEVSIAALSSAANHEHVEVRELANSILQQQGNH